MTYLCLYYIYLAVSLFYNLYQLYHVAWSYNYPDESPVFLIDIICIILSVVMSGILTAV